MAHKFADIAFTPNVRAVQQAEGSRRSYARLDDGPDHHDSIGAAESEFIEARDSFYMATVSETGWPYIQHRGGPKGFVKVLSPRLIGFADFRGNRQYVTVGNLAANDRVSLFFMDYPNQRRLKLLGRVRLVDLKDDPSTIPKLETPEYGARPERGFLIEVEAFDWNCPQHITQRFLLEEVRPGIERLQSRIEELEAKLAALGATESVP